MKNSTVLLFFLLLMLFSCRKESSPQNILLDVQDLSSLQTMVQEGVSLVFFHASWCSLCARQRKEINPIVGDSALSQIQFLEVDYEKNASIVSHYSVQGFPTILIFKEGEIAHTLLGANNKREDLKQLLLQLI
jgi:thioredoxin 1